MRTWKNVYTAELSKRRKDGNDESVLKELPAKRIGRPYLLGDELEMQVRAYLKSLREHGAVVNSAIAIGCAEGIIRNSNSSLLAQNGGHITLTKTWGKNLLRSMGYVKRRASTKAKVSIHDFDAVKTQFLLDI